VAGSTSSTPLIATTVTLAIFGLAGLGCSGADGAPPVESGEGMSIATPGAAVDRCAAPAEGCPCTTPKEEAKCKVVRRSGKYVTCSDGARSCGEDLLWGPCVGDRIWNPDAGPAGEDDAGHH
jgi:hypothetical protein